MAGGAPPTRSLPLCFNPEFILSDKGKPWIELKGLPTDWAALRRPVGLSASCDILRNQPLEPDGGRGAQIRWWVS